MATDKETFGTPLFGPELNIVQEPIGSQEDVPITLAASWSIKKVAVCKLWNESTDPTLQISERSFVEASIDKDVVVSALAVAQSQH